MIINKWFRSLWTFLEKLQPKKLLNPLFRVLGLTIVWTYRLLLSPFLGGRCRFSPSCSCYAEEALKTHPPQTAFRLILVRLSQCRPGGLYGLDPVPRASAEGLQQ